MKEKKRPTNSCIFLSEIIDALTLNGTMCEEIENACLMPRGYLDHLIQHPNEVRLTDVALIAAVSRVDVFFKVYGLEPPFTQKDLRQADALESCNPKNK